MTNQNTPRFTFPSDGKVLVVGFMPEQRMSGRYHKRAYFWSTGQVMRPADVPRKAKAALVFTHTNPSTEFDRVWACVANVPYRRQFNSAAALSNLLAELLNGVDTRIDPDDPEPLPSSPTSPPKGRMHFPAAIMEVSQPETADHQEDSRSNQEVVTLSREEVLAKVGDHANLTTTDEVPEARRIFFLLNATAAGVAVEDIVQELRRRRAAASPPIPLPATASKPKPRSHELGPSPGPPRPVPPPLPDLTEEETKGAIVIPRDRIRRFKNQPRTYFDPTGLERLARSIKSVGQMVPIIVKRVKGDPNHDYELIDGERRWRACELAGIATMRAVVREVADYADQKITSLVANFNQEGHTPLETARSIAELQGFPEISSLSAGQAIQRIGEIFGRTDAWVYQHLNLLKLDPKVQALMEPITPLKHRINGSIGIALCSVPDVELQVSIAEEISRQGMKTTQARNYIQHRMHEAQVGKAGRPRDVLDEFRIVRSFIRRTAEGGELVLNLPKRSIDELLRGKNQDEISRLIDQAEQGLTALTLILEELKKLRKTTV